MIRLAQDLTSRLAEAVRAAQAHGALPAFDLPELTVTHAEKLELGDYTTPAAMRLAKLARMKPDDIAQLIAAHFPETEYVGSVEAVRGFVNFRLADAWLQRQVDVILAEGERFGRLDSHAGQKAQVECVSANPTGPITVGRIRGGVIGDTLARILRSVGYTTELEYYYNDAGSQIDHLGESLRARYLTELGRATPVPADGYQGDYVIGLAKDLIAIQGSSLMEGDDLSPFKKFAVEKISAWQKKSLARVGIVFDNYFSEQSVYTDGSIEKVLDMLKERDLTYSALVPDKLEGSDQDQRPDAEEREATATGPALYLRLIRIRGARKDVPLVKSIGEPTYRLPDIAYHVNKLNRGFDIAINVLGADHIDEAKDVKATVGALGYPADRIRHIIHQFVTLSGSKQSTRRGEYVTLDELVDEVGADAVRYFTLARSPDSKIDFDLDLAVEQSSENPVYYIQNARVRCVSMARVAAERGLSGQDGDVSLLTDPRELALIRKLIELPEIVELAAEDLAPHKLAFWAHEELARLFHPTYEEVRALHTEVPQDRARARLKLYEASRVVFERVLALLGMSAPDTM